MGEVGEKADWQDKVGGDGGGIHVRLPIQLPPTWGAYVLATVER